MGKHGQKRRGKKARQASSGGGRGRSPVSEEEAALPPDPAEEARARRRPRWLQASMLSPAGGPPPGDDDGAVLQVALAVAQGRPPHQLAALLAEVTSVDAVLLGRGTGPADLVAVGEHRNTLKAPDSALQPLLTPDLLADAFGSSSPIVLPDVSRDPRIPPVQSSRTGSLVVVALSGPTGPCGLLALGRREVGAIYERDVARAARLGAELGWDLVQSASLLAGFTDPGTGLLSRQGVLAWAFRELERARRRERPLSAVLVRPSGLDGSRPAADAQLLQDLAHRAERASRAAELVARFDRRTLLLLLEADADAAEEACERLLRDLGPSPESEHTPATLTAGLAEAGPAEEPGAWLGRALQALEGALEAGGARIGRSVTEESALAPAPVPSL